jgi:hypothetical protein
MSTYVPTFSRDDCQQFADRILKTRSWRKRLAIVDATIASLSKSDSPKTWQWYLKRFRNWVAAISENSHSMAYVPFSVFAETGNVKLPFVSFSTLPGFSCPGAGDCLKFCYSYRAWRYPAAFFRQLQNTILLQTASGREVIADTFRNLQTTWNEALQDYRLTLRLYVDGDFDSVSTFVFWMTLLRERSHDCDAYGYSKSWLEILQGLQHLEFVPTNYVLNVSSGSLHNDMLKSKILSLPFTRDVFEAVEIDGTDISKGFARYDQREYHKRTREAYKTETGIVPFSCPGNCGTCRASAGIAACADLQFTIPIVNGVH